MCNACSCISGETGLKKEVDKLPIKGSTVKNNTRSQRTLYHTNDDRQTGHTIYNSVFVHRMFINVQMFK